MDPMNLPEHYTTELQITCRAEHVAEVLAQLPPGIEMAEVPTQQPPGIEGQPGVITLLGVVPDGVWTPDAENRLRELGRQRLLQGHGLSRYRAGTKFVTFEEMRSGKYAGQLVAVRPWDMPRLDQLPPGVTVKRSSTHYHAEGRPPQED